jgi:hypothetical protein
VRGQLIRILTTEHALAQLSDHTQYTNGIAGKMTDNHTGAGYSDKPFFRKILDLGTAAPLYYPLVGGVVGSD